MSELKPSTLSGDLAGKFDDEAARSFAKLVGGLYDDLRHRLEKEDLPRLEEAFRRMVETYVRADGSETPLAEARQRADAALSLLSEGPAEARSSLRELLGKVDILAVGGGAENSVLPYVTEIARREYGLTLTSLDRRNIEYPDGRFDDIYFYAEGVREGGRELLVADAKAHPGMRDIDRFAEWVGRVTAGAKHPVHSLVIVHSVSPEVERYLAERHPEIRILHGNDLELRYDRLKTSPPPTSSS